MKVKTQISLFIFGGLFLAIIVKAFLLQVWNREGLIAYSESQIVREVKVFPKRGNIFDRDGEPLALNILKYNLFTFGKDINELKKELVTLKKIVPRISTQEILLKTKKRKKFTWIARKLELTSEQVRKIKKLDSILIESIFSRIYPNNQLLAQTLGFVGVDNEGLSGVELFFNKILKGRVQIHKYFKDAKGRPVKFEKTVQNNHSQDITLSISKDIQAALERFLKEGVESSKAKLGGAAVMDAETGEIWAMANYPTFDPNKITSKDKGNIKLSFVTDPFEPGSTMKSLTVAAAIENNIVKKTTNYYCEKGKMKVGIHTIKESDAGHGFEWLKVEDILAYSSNIGTTKIAFDLGYDRLRDSFKDFGLGEKTGIELHGESRGIFEDKSDVSDIRLSNMSFGQGVATTAIQMLRAYAVFANGGRLVEPTIVKRDEKKEFPEILSREAAEDVVDMLQRATEKGTGSNAKIMHFQVAGKTSTAQKPRAGGGYEGYVSGFIGFPLNSSSRFVTLVYIDDPKEGYYGNAVAAPVFQKIVKYILYKNKEYDTVAKEKLYNRVKGKDVISLKYSSIKKAKNMDIIPDFIGLDKVSARAKAREYKIDLKLEGHGIVRQQVPAPGSLREGLNSVQVKLDLPDYE